MVGIAIAGLAIVAATFLLIVRRRDRKSSLPMSILSKPLLEGSGGNGGDAHGGGMDSGSGIPTGVELRTLMTTPAVSHATQAQQQQTLGGGSSSVGCSGSHSVPEDGTFHTMQNPSHATRVALFDPETGFPMTPHAEAIVAAAWRADTDTAAPHSRQSRQSRQAYGIPYATLAAASAGFCPSMRIGGGGSCVVYRAQVYGVNVAIKALGKEDQEEQMLSEGEHEHEHEHEHAPGGAQGGKVRAVASAANTGTMTQAMLTLDDKQFFAEMALLQSVCHPNICRLLAVRYLVRLICVLEIVGDM